MSARSDLLDLIRQARAQGFAVMRTRRGHWVFRAPDGIGTAAAAQSQAPRNLRKARADLRRIGLREDG